MKDDNKKYPTKKDFIKFLNEEDKNSKRWLAKDDVWNWPKWNLKPTKRLYWDYLYSQDKALFDWYFEQWKKELNLK